MRIRISVFVYPAAVACFLAAFLIRALAGSTASYAPRSLVSSLAVCALWFVLFLLMQYRGMKSGKYPAGAFVTEKAAGVVFLSVLFLCIGWFDACNIWGREYLSLFPDLRIDSGSVVLTDTLFHTSLAEGFRGGIRPTSLQNYPHVLNYHCFSHLLIRILSVLSGLTPFLAYNFLYPVVFLPLYALAQVFAVSMAGRYFADRADIGTASFLVLFLFHVGTFGGTTLYRLGIYKAHYLTSESFLAGNILFLFFLWLAFWWLHTKRPLPVLMVLIIPLFLFFATWAKVSAGPMLAALIMWFLFRKGLKDIRCWLCNLLYLMVLLGAFALFLYTAGDFSGGAKGITFHLSIYPYTKTVPRFIGHVLYLSFWGILWVILALRDRKNGRTAGEKPGEAGHERKIDPIWIEEVIVLTIVGFLPDVLLHDFNSLFFSHIIPIPAVVFLCGSHLTDEWVMVRLPAYLPRKETLRRIIFTAGVILAALYCILQTKRSISHPFEQATLTAGENIYAQCMEIRSLAGGRVRDCALYLEPGVCGTKTYDNDAFVLTAYTGLTGMEVINATYREDGKQYTFSGQTPGAGSYALDLTNDRGRLTFDEAVSRAREQGFTTLIHVMPDGYEQVRLTE